MFAYGKGRVKPCCVAVVPLGNAVRVLVKNGDVFGGDVFGGDVFGGNAFGGDASGGDASGGDASGDLVVDLAVCAKSIPLENSIKPSEMSEV
jgi:hypothetical protein